MFARLSAACFTLLLRQFPAAFRARYGGEMLDAFERERDALVRERGAWSALRYSLAAYLDLIGSGFYERRRHQARPTLDWELFRSRMFVFSRSSVVGSASVAPRLSAGAIAVRADFVSGEFFAMLGTPPAAGRLLTAEDDRAGAPPAVVISYDLWIDEFQQRADVIGRPLHVGDVAFTIVGVAPEGFVGLNPGELVADPEHGAPYLILPAAAAPLVRSESRYASNAGALGDRWLGAQTGAVAAILTLYTRGESAASTRGSPNCLLRRSSSGQGTPSWCIRIYRRRNKRIRRVASNRPRRRLLQLSDRDGVAHGLLQ